MADQKQQQPEAFDTLADNKTVRNLVFVGSGLAALTTAAVSIWSEFYHEIKNIGPIHQALSTRKTSIEEAYAKGVAAEGVAEKFTPHDVRVAVRNANKIYTTALKDILPKVGISNELILGTIDRAKNLGVYNLGGIAMKTGASLAITLGGYYLINQNVRLKKNNERQDERLRDLRDRIDAQESRRIESFERAGR